MDPRKAWKKGYNGVNATNALAKGGIQKEDQRYNDRVSPPANSPPQPVQHDMTPRVGENATYFHGYPQAGPTSPFAVNTATYIPPQSPPMHNYTTAPHPTYPPQQNRQDYMPGNYAHMQGSPPLGSLSYFDHNQQNRPHGFQGNYNGNTGYGAYPYAPPVQYRSNTVDNYHDFEVRPEPIIRRSTTPASYGAPMPFHDCATERLWDGRCGKCQRPVQ